MKRRAFVTGIGIASVWISGCLSGSDAESPESIDTEIKERLEHCVERYAEQHAVGEGSAGVISFEVGSIEEFTDEAVRVEVDSEVEVSGSSGDDLYGDVWHELYSEQAHYHVRESGVYRMNTANETPEEGIRVHC